MAAEFNTVHKTKNAFSAMAIDQAHEQDNCAIKGDEPHPIPWNS